jgi:GxxExxY protein
LVDNRVIVECKAVKELAPIDEARTINYMKLSKVPAALLINFNEVLLKNGLRRFVNKDQS